MVIGHLPPDVTWSAGPSGGEPTFAWKDHGRFVELHPVRSGWLLLWGRHADRGRQRVVVGNRLYPRIADARRRFADAVLELTRKPALAAEALALLDRASLSSHCHMPLPDPL